MRTVEEVRRLRLAQLREEYGSLAKIGDLLGLSARDSTLSQIANKSVGSKTGTPKNMGSPMARRLEMVCEKETGWMDTDPAFDSFIWPFEGVTPARVLALPEKLLQRATGSVRTLVDLAIEEGSLVEPSGKQRGKLAA